MKPDFSGEFELDRAASTLSTHASAMVSARMRIRHEDPRFACSARFASHDDAIEFSFERFTDGRAECFWENDILVSEDHIPTPNGEMLMTWRYELSPDGKRMRATERIRGAGRDQDNVWEFERRASGPA